MRSLTIHCYQSEAGADHAPLGDAQGITLHYAPLDALREHIPSYQELLDPSEHERAARFRFEVDRERFIIGHGVLRILLGKQLSEDPAGIAFARGPHGKPFIPGSPLHFNLSDTKDALLIGLSTVQEIGVDIETMRRRVDHLAVSEHYFTPEEVQAIASANDTKRRFLEFWTRKEAVLKASGVGIMDDLHALRVDQGRNTIAIKHPEFMRMAAPAYFVRTFHLGADHIISVASPELVDRIQLTTFPHPG